MTSFMNILVSVRSERAMAQIAALRGGVQGLESGIRNANGTPLLGARHISSLMKFGNQLQWTGRMLQYNFTLPLLLAGGAALKFSMDQEKAFVHVKKVYGDVQTAAEQFQQEQKKLTDQMAQQKATRVFTGELEALDEAFTAISNHYGVQKKEVNEVAGAWAAAGASGLDLAKSVDATMQAMIIGDMASADATRALISIQAQYNLSSSELTATLANLNSIENQTAANMSDLIIGFEKAAGVARSAGIETNQLAAYMAALVPATGSAATAGNALKTIISRLMSPTKEAKQVMEAMGLEVTAMSWQSATASERLQIMAKEFNGLGSAAQGAAASVIASRWQVNRFETLMRELVNTNGNYTKAMKASEDQGASFRRMQTELNAVLESNPRALQRMMVMLQNASVKIIQPLIPFILYLADSVADLAASFADLNPHTQKFIIFGLVLLAAIGPIVKYMGAFATLTGVLGVALHRSVGLLALFVRFIGMITFIPLLRGLSVFAAWIGGTSGLIATQGSMWRTMYLGFLGFFSKWTVAVAGIFRVGALLNLKIWTTGIIAQLGASRAGFAMQLISFKIFRLKLKLLWIAATLETTSRWAAMWLMIKGITAAGWASLAMTGPMKAILMFFTIWRSALLVIWSGLWGRIVAVGAAGWALVRAQWVVGAITGVGIFSRMRAALAVIWATTAAINATIWRGIALTMVMFSRAGIVGVIGVFKSLIPFLLKFARFATGPWGILISVIVGLVYACRDQIAQVFKNIGDIIGHSGEGIAGVFAAIGDGIMKAFTSLPQGVQDVMVAVVTVIRDAALAIYDWFSYINPWAHHSPSLVENVTTGMDAVKNQFAGLSVIKGYVGAAYNEIKKFGNLTAQLGVSANAMQRAEDRATLKKAGAGAALGSYNKLIALLNKLTPILARLEAKVNAQQAVVDRWKAKVDAANAALDRQQRKLDSLNKVLDKYQSKLDEANDNLQMFANAPLEGMQAMEEQIFKNQMAQTKLRLEMMNLEDTFGTYDQLKSKIEAINGAQEMLRGEQASLRSAGAGSEILGQYDEEMKKLDQQRDKYEETADKLADMQAKLDKLQRQAEKLDLIKAMKFDELQHQIDNAANSMKEMSFEEIMQGIKDANAQIDKYGPKVDQASAAVAHQQAVVDKLTEARDRLQARLDAEERTLEKIKDRYTEVNDAIQAINSSISDVIGAAGAMNEAMGGKNGGSAGYISPGLQNFLDAGNANFPDPGGSGIPPRSDWSSQKKDIEKFTESLGLDTAAMFESLNPFTPLKAKAIEFWDWFKIKAGSAFSSIGDLLGQVFSGVGGGGDTFAKIKDALGGIGSFFTEAFKSIGKFVKAGWDLLGPDIINIGKGIWDGLKGIWDEVGPELAKFGDLIKPLGKAIQNIWTVAKPILAAVGGAFLAMAKIVLSVIGETIGPLLKDVGGIIAGIIRVIRGVFEVIIGILTGDWKMAWQGVKNIVTGTVKAVWKLISGTFKLIWNIIVGFIKGIIGWFKWLWDVLVGHSIIPDIVNGIFYWFKLLGALAVWVWDHVVKPVVDGFLWLFNKVIAGIKLWWAGVKLAWSALKTAAVWLWNNVLKPVWNKFKQVWNDYIFPAIKAWWAGFKLALNAFKTAAVWLWNNVLKPVWNKFKEVWDKVGPELKSWWARIQVVWAALKTAAVWLWNNVLKPVWDKVQDVWIKVKSSVGGWWEGIKKVWSTLTGLGKWVYDHVMKPVYDKITGVWGTIKTWLNDNKDMLTTPVKGIVNVVIDAVNAIIKGLNKVADVLPGIDWEISLITRLAKGGEIPTRGAGRGFKTSGARAIVGEGKPNHPEFVIPTDPTHRKRAKSLMAMAAAKIGLAQPAGGDIGDIRNQMKSMSKTNPMGNRTALPEFGIGGWLGDRWDDAKGLAKQIADLPKDIVGKTVNLALDKGEDIIKNKTGGWKPIQSPPLSGIEKLRGWVTDTDANVAKAVDQASGGPEAARALKWARSMQGTPYLLGGFSTEGIDCSGFMSAIANVYKGNAPFTTRGTTATFPWAGWQAGVAPGKGFTVGSTAKYPGSPYGHMAGTVGGFNVESRGGTGVLVGSAARGYMDSGFNEVYHLAAGGVAKARRGGYLANIGEGGYDEAVVPLPKDWKSNLSLAKGDGGDKTYNFYGDLEFPNVTDGSDAQAFLDNLDSLAKD